MRAPAHINLLLVEESPDLRALIRSMLAVDPHIHIVGEAADAFEARKLLVALEPHVMLLDVHLPKMDGIRFLEKVMKHFPVRTLAMSNAHEQSSQLMVEAIAAGAIDVMEKPHASGAEFHVSAERLIQKIKTVAGANLGAFRERPGKTSTENTPSAPKVFAKRLIAIASSTGGTEALKHVIPKLEMGDAATMIVQHLPEHFVQTYVDHLRSLCAFPVKEAEDGEKIIAGTVYIAPGNFHMEVRQAGAQYAVVLHQKPLLNSIRPSADYLMNSIARLRQVEAIGIVLTGMGKDGAAGLLAMRQKGSFNLAQDESTSIIYGMPKEAERLGAIDKTVGLDDIADEVNVRLRRNKAA